MTQDVKLLVNMTFFDFVGGTLITNTAVLYEKTKSAICHYQLCEWMRTL